MAATFPQPLQFDARVSLTPLAFRIRFSRLQLCTVIPLTHLIDKANCFQTVRDLRWPDDVACPQCDSKAVVKHGKDETQPDRQRSDGRACARRFDDLTGTVLAGHHQPLKVWISWLYLMGLNLSCDQIAQELDLDHSDALAMTTMRRQGIVQRRPEPVLSGEVECDEVYVVAGHKGHPEAVKKKAGFPAEDA
jgi:transposase-like protein